MKALVPKGGKAFYFLGNKRQLGIIFSRVILDQMAVSVNMPFLKFKRDHCKSVS